MEDDATHVRVRGYRRLPDPCPDPTETREVNPVMEQQYCPPSDAPPPYDTVQQQGQQQGPQNPPAILLPCNHLYSYPSGTFPYAPAPQSFTQQQTSNVSDSQSECLISRVLAYARCFSKFISYLLNFVIT